MRQRRQVLAAKSLLLGETDEMKSLVHHALAQANDHTIALDEIDISTDRELLERYGLEIPVLLSDGKKVASSRVSERELTQMLAGRTSRGEG